jgi:Na+-driven multidrug efflux pump
VAFVLQRCLHLPLVWLIGVHLGYGLPGIAICRALFFILESARVALMWRHGFWSRAVGGTPVSA